MKRLRFIDLFAGAGGLSEGFIRAGFEAISHVEMDKAACFTLRTRAAYHYLVENGQIDEYRKYLRGELSRTDLYALVPNEKLEAVINLSIGEENNSKIFTEIDKSLNGYKVDLIIGGPPCQAYSLVGRARDKNKMEGDPRNFLFLEYAKYLDRYKPKVFVFENVTGLFSAKGGYYLEEMKSRFLESGYKIKVHPVEANHFGVLQNRKRLIIIGWDQSTDLSNLDLSKVKIPYSAKVADLFKDLPDLQAGEGCFKSGRYSGEKSEYLNWAGIRNGIPELTLHVARPHSEQDKEIYRKVANQWNESGTRMLYNELEDRLKTHENRHSFHDRFKVVAPDKSFSHTVVAHIHKDGHYYIHPDVSQNRSISVREAARIQSFPDDFYFESVKQETGKGPAFKQIGNAVPPLLAFQIAIILKNHINCD
jgi:DNA (cytosine-5)-methyltransferase 1